MNQKSSRVILTEIGEDKVGIIANVPAVMPAIPTIFVNADAIGYKGTELQDAINGDVKALAMFETIRAYGAVRMGLIKHIEEAAKRQHTPKVAFVAPPTEYVSSSGKKVQSPMSICWCARYRWTNSITQ